MCSAHIIVDQAIRHVEGIVFVLTGCDRNRCFVTTKDDRTEDNTVILHILSYNILENDQISNMLR